MGCGIIVGYVPAIVITKVAEVYIFFICYFIVFLTGGGISTMVILQIVENIGASTHNRKYYYLLIGVIMAIAGLSGIGLFVGAFWERITEHHVIYFRLILGIIGVIQNFFVILMANTDFLHFIARFL